MAMPKAKTLDMSKNPLPGDLLFEVTCVIGAVRMDEHGGQFTPTEAAYLLIARHDAEGTFSFPGPSGETYHVTVERELPADHIASANKSAGDREEASWRA